jgi:hypothetical protein
MVIPLVVLRVVSFPAEAVFVHSRIATDRLALVKTRMRMTIVVEKLVVVGFESTWTMSILGLVRTRKHLVARLITKHILILLGQDCMPMTMPEMNLFSL